MVEIYHLKLCLARHERRRLLASRISVRILKVVWGIEHSRAVEATLVVAEERPRFSRDLHDILGRDLSVITAKSELARRVGPPLTPRSGGRDCRRAEGRPAPRRR